MPDTGKVWQPRLIKIGVSGLLLVGLLLTIRSAWQGLTGGRAVDIHRRWVVCQYIREGINPYPVALAALRTEFGPVQDLDLRKTRIYSIPNHVPSVATGKDSAADLTLARLRESLGNPEAVYPPATDLLLTISLGALPEAYVHASWLCINLGLLLVCCLLLQYAGVQPRRNGLVLLAGLTGIFLIFAPTQASLADGQFSLLALACLLLELHMGGRSSIVSGVLLSLALLKPSLGIPFLILPLVRKRWAVLAVVVVIHGGATLLQGWWLGCTPWSLLYGWLEVSSYFTQGMYTLQDVLNASRLAGSPTGLALTGGFLFCAAGWCWLNRQASDLALFDFLCFVSALWTYHGSYDFVILFVPFLSMAFPGHGRSTAIRTLAGLSLACLGLATCPLVYGDETLLAWRLVRQMTRLMLGLWLVTMAFRLRRLAHVESAGTGDVLPLPNPQLAGG
jgi:hypothetical protein